MKLLPVDSEHSAIWQCLNRRAEDAAGCSSLILTASGGPFRGRTREQIADATLEQALKHPTWNMGVKVSVDSATMMNKGFEIIEAMHLFGVPADRIEVVVHRQSVVHSMIAFADGSIIAQMSYPDMRLPIEPRSALSGSGATGVFLRCRSTLFHSISKSRIRILSNVLI